MERSVSSARVRPSAGYLPSSAPPPRSAAPPPPPVPPPPRPGASVAGVAAGAPQAEEEAAGLKQEEAAASTAASTAATPATLAPGRGGGGTGGGGGAAERGGGAEEGRYPAEGLTRAEETLLSMPAELRLEGGGGGSRSLVDLVPSVVLASTPLHQVHLQFSLLSIDHAYVVFAGRLLGVIRRSQLVSLQAKGT
eukprot:Transcript_30858.p1 GENE.Transcript_30858~~Transcript_30858.p1  ORF type:complete len:194 (+),score=47.53 Transcript_30858:363-944(+)